MPPGDTQMSKKTRADRKGTGIWRKNLFTILEFHRSQMSTSKPRQGRLDSHGATARDKDSTESGKIKISTSDPVCAVQITAIDQILNTPVKANIIWEGFTSRFLLFDITTNVHLADVLIELKNSNDLDIVEIRRFVSNPTVVKRHHQF
ncbi:uncharacterized protein TNCV_24641 [Trichonephila clavipes]|uniref:Uncharacterized protein n=1 Tax=Trichonephila clavipes TaxID=2585209 RepID=A0A8X7BBW3_TRICX|nr:uncharacterized protein TNCV_24641 [Trichonephila clavipes]